MPIYELTTKVQKTFLRLAKIKKGEKDEKGNMRDLDYFRIIFEKGILSDMVESMFRKAYGEKPTRINFRLAFSEIADVWDAFYVCYEKGGQLARAGSNENGLYWDWYRDHGTKEVLVRYGKPTCQAGVDLMAKPIDLLAPVYKSQAGNEAFLEPEGRLVIVVPEVTGDGSQPGFFEFCPGTAADIRRISSELAGIMSWAKSVGKDITGIPMVLTRREEMVTVNINHVLSRKKSWVVHIELSGEWAGKALEARAMLSLPSGEEDEIIEGATSLVDEGEFPDLSAAVQTAKPAQPTQPTGLYKDGSTSLPSVPAVSPPVYAPAPVTGEIPLVRPYSPEVFKAKLLEIVHAMPAVYAEKNIPLTLVPANIGNVLAKIMDQIFVDKGVSRHLICAWFFGHGSTKEMTAAEVRALFKVMGIKYDEEHTPDFESAPSTVSMDELRACAVAANEYFKTPAGALEEPSIPF